jgi:hypothetical protein
MTRAAQRDRGDIPLGYPGILAGAYDLLEVRQPNQVTARALLFFIQYVSEAARFRRVGDMMYDVMNGATHLGVPAGVQELENIWSALSAWGYTTQASAPLEHLVRAMMLLLGNLNQAPPTGDVKHTEL